MTPVYDQIWYWKSRLPERRGQRCRVLARGNLNSILVEFDDGYKVVTGRYAVRPGGSNIPKQLGFPLF